MTQPLSPTNGQTRRKPRQRRSRETVDAILQAAARVFAERGHGGATTNHIAATAGVSVGSLYEYFSNKEEILLSLAERQRDAMVARVRQVLESRDEDACDLRVVLERFVIGLLEAHEQDPDLHRVVFGESPSPPALHACALAMEEQLARALLAQLARCDGVVLGHHDPGAHIVVRTADALAHRFVERGLHDVEREAFVAETVRLLTGYVG